MVIKVKNKTGIVYKLKIKCSVCKCNKCLINEDTKTIKCLSCNNKVIVNDIYDLFGWIADVIKKY